MLGEKIGEISGKVTMQRVLSNLGGYPKMETSFQATGSVLGTNIKGHRHVHDHFPSGRDTIWRRSRRDDHEGRQNGHLDRPWCWHIEKRRNRDFSRRPLFPNHATTMVTPEQGSSAIRVRSRRRGQYALRILGMEVVLAARC